MELISKERAQAFAEALILHPRHYAKIENSVVTPPPDAAQLTHRRKSPRYKTPWSLLRRM